MCLRWMQINYSVFITDIQFYTYPVRNNVLKFTNYSRFDMRCRSDAEIGEW